MSAAEPLRGVPPEIGPEAATPELDVVRAVSEGIVMHQMSAEGTKMKEALDNKANQEHLDGLVDGLYADGLSRDGVYEAVHRLMFRYHLKKEEDGRDS